MTRGILIGLALGVYICVFCIAASADTSIKGQDKTVEQKHLESLHETEKSLQGILERNEATRRLAYKSLKEAACGDALVMCLKTTISRTFHCIERKNGYAECAKEAKPHQLRCKSDYDKCAPKIQK